MFKEFINEYGLTIVYAVLTAVAGFLGTQLKRIYESKVNTETKRKCAESVVKMVEQVYTNRHGDEKYIEAEKALVDMLSEKGIIITDLECEVLIEAAVLEFNKRWKDEH